jgi:hypothetical protein
MPEELQPELVDPNREPQWVTVLKEKVKDGRIRDPEMRKMILEL